MYARMASGLFLALGFADLAVLNLVLAPRLAQHAPVPCADERAGAAVSSAGAREEKAESVARPAATTPAADEAAAAARAPIAEPALAPAIPDVTFALGDVRVMSPHALASVRELAHTLADAPDKRLLVRGHSDRLGTLAENRMLSWQRAEAVTRLLAIAGAPLDHITIECAGSAEPADPSDNPTGWAKNRRVQLLWR